jgi:methyltransferase
MEGTHFYSYTLLFFYVGERMIELALNQINLRFMISKYLVTLYSPSESMQMRLFNFLWILALIAETYWHGEMAGGVLFYFAFFFLVLAQVLRWYTIFTLGPFWSIDVYQMKEHPIISSGPYLYIRHPNYLAVMIEFFFVPFILGCPLTLLIGFPLNYLILQRRVNMEEDCLIEQSKAKKKNYQNTFQTRNRYFLNSFHFK